MTRLEKEKPLERPHAQPYHVVGELFISERTKLTSLALRITRNVFDAEDVVQSAFTRALEHAEQLVSATARRGWLHTTVTRLAIDRARTEKRRPRADVDLNAVPALEHELIQSWHDVSVEHVKRTLDKGEVDPVLRETFELWWFHGLAYKHIAARLQIQVSTVGTRLHRAKQQLRQALLQAPHAGRH